MNLSERKRARNRERKQVEAFLVSTYPQLFNLRNLKPLALGVAKQVQAEHPQIPLAALRAALGLWCRRKQYLFAVAEEGSQRYNLDGSVAGSVSDSEREYSLSELERRQDR